MRTFSWEYFTLTGDVDAYLLYKDMHQLDMNVDAEEYITDEENEQTVTNLI
jgi:hypothetical protein